MMFGMGKHNFSCHCKQVQNKPITNYFFIQQQSPAVTNASKFCLHFIKGYMCFHWDIFSFIVPHVSNGCYYMLLQCPGLSLCSHRAAIGKQS